MHTSETTMLGIPRRLGLGHYNAKKSEWKIAYQNARKMSKCNVELDYKVDGIAWKAMLIVKWQRNDASCDPLLSSTIQARLVTQKIINEILSEEDEIKS